MCPDSTRDYVCEFCGESFTPTNPKNPNRFCSQKCNGAFQRARNLASQPVVPCPECGKEFRLKPKRRKDSLNFCSRKCRYAYHSKAMSGENGPHWNGGRHLDSKGYVRIWVEGKGRISEHRHVWEEAHGPIPDGYVVHHVDGNPLNNHLSNLQLVTRAEHQQIHLGLNGRWSRNYDSCLDCGTTERRHFGYGYCTACYTRRYRSGGLPHNQ